MSDNNQQTVNQVETEDLNGQELNELLLIRRDKLKELQKRARILLKSPSLK